MAGPNVLTPHPPEFEPFLHASIGEDRNGHVVTVFSALARLGLDPWREAADLAALGHDAARARLGPLLARFRDVPTLASDHARVARDLSQLLPEGRMLRTVKRGALPSADGRPGTSRAIWAVFAIIFVLFQVVMLVESGSGQ